MAGVRKFKFERRVGRSVVNPLVAKLDRMGIRSSLVLELETTGAKSGQPRRVPLTGTDDDVRARARSFMRGKMSGAATAAAMRAMESDPISVRVTYTD